MKSYLIIRSYPHSEIFLIDYDFPFGDVISCLKSFKRNSQFFCQFVLNNENSFFSLILEPNPTKWTQCELLFFIKYEIFRFNIDGNIDGTYDELVDELAKKKISAKELLNYKPQELQKIFQNEEIFNILNEILNEMHYFFNIKEKKIKIEKKKYI